MKIIELHYKSGAQTHLLAAHITEYGTDVESGSALITIFSTTSLPVKSPLNTVLRIKNYLLRTDATEPLVIKEGE